jgi:Tfp pilus assembly protein FimT
MAILGSIAIPCVNSPMLPQEAAQSTAERLARHLRLARTLAVLHGSDNPDGYALMFLGPGGDRYSSYTIVDQSDGRQLPNIGIVSTQVYSTKVTCNSSVKGVEYYFSPQGDVDIFDTIGAKAHGDPILEVSGGGALYTIHITEGTGHVQLQQSF